MKDLTQGPIPKLLIAMALPMAIGMLVQTLYYLVDLWFVAQLGDAAIAGVGAAGNIMLVVLGLTNMVGVGTVALVAQATGRQDRADANLVFNQAIVLSAACGLATLVAGYAAAGPYMRSLGADAATTQAGIEYLHWFVPGLALQFALVAMGSALRGTGIVMPTMIVQMVSLLVNTALAPVLIAGWGSGRPLGVAGAGLATTIATLVGVALLAVYFVRLETFVALDRALLRPRLDAWKRLLAIGLPAGGEFVLMFVFMAVIYAVIRDFGPAAQAGFGIGSRVMQAIFLPAMVIAFAVAPIAGQNFGAQRFDRVRATFATATVMSCSIMLALTLACQWRPDAPIALFTAEADVIAVGATFLRLVSWNFVASGLIFCCSGLFQGLGDTKPALFSTASRLVTFVVPVLWLARQPGFRIEHVWYVSVASVALQALTSWALARLQMRRRLDRRSAAPAAA